MAIDPKSPATPRQQTIAHDRVEAWTVTQAADALAATSISIDATPRASAVRGMAVTIDIPLDEPTSAHNTPRPAAMKPFLTPKPDPVHTVYKRRTPIRRDSLVHREALLMGKEGSRRRQRWDNNHLIGNPWAEPPLPSDWAVQPTYPRQAVPYAIAPLWDAGYAAAAQERKVRERAARIPALSQEETTAAKVTQQLRAKLKKARGAKGLLQDLEREVRGFVQEWEEKQRQLEAEGVIEPDSEDEEIVFVGRNGRMSDERALEREGEQLAKDKLIFQSLVDNHGAAFGRYLVHAIAAYYGLKTWSVTTGSPARREAYVGLDLDPKTRRPSLTRSEMPRPLWAVI